MLNSITTKHLQPLLHFPSKHLNSLQETKSSSSSSTNNTRNTRNPKHMAMPRTSMAALLLAYLSPYPVSSSSSTRNTRNRDRKNPRLSDPNDPMVLMSPQVGCLGQLKTRHHTSHGLQKRKQKAESNILVRCLVPLFKASSRVQDVPRSTKMLVTVNITEIDPPLPVRMVKQEDLYKVSLWERRAGVKELGKLQVKEKRRQMTTLADILFS